MLKKCLLVIGALVIGLVEGMDRDLLSDHASGGTRIESSSFFNEYRNLHMAIRNQIGFSKLEKSERGYLEERMSDIEEQLLAICDGAIANYSEEDGESEVRRLATPKAYHLQRTVSEFFEDLHNALQDRKYSISKWFSSSNERIECENLSNFSKELDHLSSFLGRGRFRDLLVDCFRAAYERGELRGDEELQHWYALYHGYKKGRNTALGCFSPAFLNEFNNRAADLASRGGFNALNSDPLAVSEWLATFHAIRSFRFPTESLNHCLADDEILIADLRNGRIGEGYRGVITRTWKDSIERSGRRCKFFIPSSVRDIENFFLHLLQ